MAMKLDSRAVAALVQTLEWAYDKAVGGVPGLESASELAATYQRQFPNADDAIDALIRWQIAKAAAAGFITNLGGIMTLPVALPANLVSALYIQTRMVAAIAHLRGHDLHSDRVRTVVLACLCGTSLVDVAKEVGVGIGVSLAQQAVTGLSTKALKQLSHATGHVAGKSLLRRAVGGASLSRLTPLVGGLIAGLADGAVTRGYGTAAKRLFAPITEAIIVP